jgi:hypothetical protein
MKRLSSPILWAIAKLCTILATILGCSSKSVPDKPREIRWQGQETGYQGITVVPAGNGTNSGSTK